jgi:putative glycosyltransferase (TIGR04348 family)
VRALIVTPAPRGARTGNRVTALRWAAMLRALGHRVRITGAFADGREDPDLMIALHAKKSAASIRAFRQRRPHAPLFVALTGTDIYRDVKTSAEANASLELATRLIALQPRAIAELPGHLRDRARVIHQSARPPRSMERLFRDRFIACVIGHLREVKDPFLAADAAARLPPESRIAIVQLGQALDPGIEARALEIAAANPRYVWLGGQPRQRTLSILAGSDVFVLTSKLEGGANVISEAIACGVPVLSTEIEGSIGLLGKDHPGYFRGGDAQGLADLLLRVEREPDLRAALADRSRALSPLVDPRRELEAWRRLLEEVEV